MLPASAVRALERAFGRYAAGDLAQAESIFRQVLQEHPNCAAVLQALGRIAHQAGNHVVALELLHRAAALAPENAIAQCDLGVVYQSLQREEEAIDAYRRAIALKSDFALAYD